jgi:hypothetical protein
MNMLAGYLLSLALLFLAFVMLLLHLCLKSEREQLQTARFHLSFYCIIVQPTLYR